MAKLTLFFRNRAILAYNLEDKGISIGRDPECDIVIDSLAVEQRHALVMPQGGDYAIFPFSDDTRVTINHQPIESHTLQHGDIIGIGKHTLSFAASAIRLPVLPNPGDVKAREQRLKPASSREPSGETVKPLKPKIDIENAGCVQVISGEHVGKVIALYRPLIRLGMTGNECAVIAHREDGYYLSHLEGENPPLVDGDPIGDRSVRLKDGNIIQVADIRLQFYGAMKQAIAV
jgi:pSer/pThr/pTyr-binding forkhead associated (FHA) protein